MADLLTLNNSEITVWADKDHPRKITGKVKVNGKQLATASSSTTIIETATVSGKGKVTLTFVAKRKPAPKKAAKKK
jgi:dTDP-4-dehydrorhamnose reductase